jgi:hypothetical protein
MNIQHKLPILLWLSVDNQIKMQSEQATTRERRAWIKVEKSKLDKNFLLFLMSLILFCGEMEKIKNRVSSLSL